MPYNSLLRPIVVTNSIRCQEGPRGKPGDQGIQGKPGDQGIQGKPGDQGIQGIAGTPGAKGDQGLQGIQGDKGDQGIQGIAGTNARTLPTGQIGFGGIGKLNSSHDLTFDNGILSVKNIKFGKDPISYKDPTRAIDRELNAIVKILGVLEDLGLMYKEVETTEEEKDGQ